MRMTNGQGTMRNNNGLTGEWQVLYCMVGSRFKI
jgi:hypothetical protein